MTSAGHGEALGRGLRWLHVLGHTRHQASELLHDRLDQLLPVSVVLPELGKYIILLAGVLHPTKTYKRKC